MGKYDKEFWKNPHLEDDTFPSFWIANELAEMNRLKRIELTRLLSNPEGVYDYNELKLLKDMA